MDKNQMSYDEKLRVDKELAERIFPFVGSGSRFDCVTMSEYTHSWLVAGALLMELTGEQSVEVYRDAVYNRFKGTEDNCNLPRAVIESCVEKLEKEATTYTKEQTIDAIENFLEFGNGSLKVAHQGYYSKGGWAFNALQSHLRDLLKEKETK